MKTLVKQKPGSRSEDEHVCAAVAAVESLDGSYSADTCDCWHLIHHSRVTKSTPFRLLTSPVAKPQSHNAYSTPRSSRMAAGPLHCSGSGVGYR